MRITKIAILIVTTLILTTYTAMSRPLTCVDTVAKNHVQGIYLRGWFENNAPANSSRFSSESLKTDGSSPLILEYRLGSGRARRKSPWFPAWIPG
jgi:hypothetical protein